VAHAYPIQLEVTGRLIVIVGGGTVAARKADGLLAAGATRVRCVSPAFHETLPAAVERVAAAYEAAHLDGATLAFAATNAPDVNDAVVRDARLRGILVNRADRDTADDATGDFTVPATHRVGPITITVAAGGNPTLAAAVRDELATQLDAGWVALAEAMTTLRPIVLAARVPSAMQRDVLRALATREAMQVVRLGGRDALLAWVRLRFPELCLDGGDVL
jgi:siroheme synthase-like protein